MEPGLTQKEMILSMCRTKLEEATSHLIELEIELDISKDVVMELTTQSGEEGTTDISRKLIKELVDNLLISIPKEELRITAAHLRVNYLRNQILKLSEEREGV